MTAILGERTTRQSPELETGLVGRNVEDGWRPRVLVVSHSHPEISKGGAEIAAFQLCSEIYHDLIVEKRGSSVAIRDRHDLTFLSLSLLAYGNSYTQRANSIG
jgi:hypothetical protein